MQVTRPVLDTSNRRRTGSLMISEWPDNRPVLDPMSGESPMSGERRKSPIWFISQLCRTNQAPPTNSRRSARASGRPADADVRLPTGNHNDGVDFRMIGRTSLVTSVALLAALLLVLTAGSKTADARRGAQDFAATLSPKDRAAFNAHLTARTFYEAQKDAYWAKVTSTRKKRRRKIRRGQLITSRDYVTEFPPEFEGPELSKSLARRWLAFRNRDKPKTERKRSTIPGVEDFLRNARRYYGFVPDRVSEREFKRRYAAEALRLGLSRDQVVRVYALETGGRGTADMQAGIHPISKKGRPISTALGYAQLLAANSTSELAKHGDTFVDRLTRLRARATTPERKRQLARKIIAVKKMVRRAKAVPFKWSRHRRFARTGPGLGIHAINMDGDIGPWLQVMKLKGVKRLAERKGRTDLESEELELMNLAGPSTGLEMMTSVGLRMPSVNFFSRRGYERNSVVRGRTSSELITELGRRMDYNQKNPGAREFFEVFDELQQERRGTARLRFKPTSIFEN